MAAKDWCQQTKRNLRVIAEFGLQMDSTEALWRHRTPAKPLKTCGGQGRNRTADASLFRAALYQLSYLAGREFYEVFIFYHAALLKR